MIKIFITIRWRDILIAFALMAIIGISYAVYRATYASTDFEITDDLSGYIFPSLILSTATTDASVIQPTDTPYVGNPKSSIAVKIRSRQKNSRVRIEIGQSPFFASSVSEFVLPRPHTSYTIYPDIVWNYEALRNIKQAEPISIVVSATIGKVHLGQRVRTFSVRSLNECLLGYVKGEGKQAHFISTKQLFAAYVNEESPYIDKILREALNTHIISSFSGYQKNDSAFVCRQVYALWNVLQKRHFQYSSVSYSSLSSNVVYSQRVRTMSDALNSSQINCVDGSVLFASLMRAINIDPVLVRIPGHMFVGFYTDQKHKHINFLETTMIGNVNWEEIFPDGNLDSTSAGMNQNEISHLTFLKSIEYANKKYQANIDHFKKKHSRYVFLEISKALRRKIQPIGK